MTDSKALREALQAATIRYSRNRGEPDPTPAFPFEVVFTMRQWEALQKALATAPASPAGSAQEESCGTAQNAITSTSEDTRPTVRTASPLEGVLSRPHRVAKQKSDFNSPEEWTKYLESLLNEKGPDVIVQSDGSCTPARSGASEPLPTPFFPLQREVDGIPRRNRVDLATPVELVIREARQQVEKMDADVRLTDATVLLGRALDKVSDYLENVPAQPPAAVPSDKLLISLAWNHGYIEGVHDGEPYPNQDEIAAVRAEAERSGKS